MAAQLSAHDQLVAELRAHIPATLGIANRAYGAAHAALDTGTRHDLERVGAASTNLAIALGALRPD